MLKINRREHVGVFREKPATGHNHTYYSLSDAPQSPDEYVKRCSEMGFTSVALNDHGTLLGVHPFIDACKKYNVNGIPGVEAYSKVCPEVLERLSDYKDFLSGRTHLILNPMTYSGYQKISYAVRDSTLITEKLIKLVYPIMTCDILEKYFTNEENVFATSACAQGAIGYILLTNKRIEKKMSKEFAICEGLQDEYQKYVSVNATYIELSNKVKELKKERTAQSKYLKPAFEKKINKLQEKIMSDSGQQTLFDEEENEVLEMQKELDEMLLHREEAKKFLDGIDEKIDSMEKKSQAYKLKVSDMKKELKKYFDAKKKIDSVKYIPDDELYDCAKAQLLYYKKIFKTFFVELQYHGIEMEEYIMPILLKLSDETNTPIIAANDAHVSVNTEDSFEARRIMRYNYFNKSQVTEDADRELYIKSDWELIDALSTVIPEDRAAEAVMNTNVFHDCHVVFPNEQHYPAVKTGETIDGLLEKAREEKIKNNQWNDVYEKRLAYELQVIKDMGYVDYHMVVRDFCNKARVLGRVPKEELENIPDDFDEAEKWVEKKQFPHAVGVGPGRGSAAGSLVCYLLGITNIDPIKYNLLFERFLNPERVSMPDIDSDIKTSLRPYIIKYLQWRYGERAVCSIMTETTYAAKGAVQMAGRERASQLYDYLPDKDAKPMRQKFLYGTTAKVSDMIPEKPGVTLDDCEEDFKQNFSGNKEAEIIWNHAKLLEGRVCATGVHAGGVIISDNSNVNDYIALAWNGKKNVWAAQCDMTKAEQIGLLKMDLLGLLTLDEISDCIHLVKKYRNIDIDIDNIPFEDEVFKEIYSKGNTNSVFQYESSGMKSMLKEFKPTCIEDLILLVACYRPGPMQYLDDIIAVKNGKKPVTYKTPELEEILSPTYGAIVYQEQVMQIFQKLAGYSLGDADMVRRAMSKKKQNVLVSEREAFVHGDEKRKIEGCVARGIKETVANQLFDEMIDFAKYAFNKSHAAAYAIVSYQTAYLKYHYTLEFMCAMFNNKSQDTFDPIYEDCTLYGVSVLPPDVNKSYFDFVSENGNIRYGFSGIKGFGAASEEFIKKVIKNRKEENYESFQQFLKVNVNVKEDGQISLPDKGIIEPLIESGAFDSMKYNRKDLIDSLETLRIEIEETDIDLYVAIDKMKVAENEKDLSYNIDKEVEYLGKILSENPLDKYQDDSAYGCTPLDELVPSKSTSLFGFVTSVTLKKSAKGNNMIMANVQGKRGSCMVIIMNNLYHEYANQLNRLEHQVIKIIGQVNDGGSVFAKDIQRISQKSEEYFIDLASKDDVEYLMRLRKGRGNLDGDVKVLIQFHWKKSRFGIEPISVPFIREFNFTNDEINAVKKHGIELQKWNV